MSFPLEGALHGRTFVSLLESSSGEFADNFQSGVLALKAARCSSSSCMISNVLGHIPDIDCVNRQTVLS
ncbi:MAG: hypothetical protein QXT73_07435 [Candidatus Methanomethylicaceae archaeon]